MTDIFEGLEWIRIFDPTHIPRYLVDQIKEKEFDTARFYQYQQLVCTEKSGDSLLINPCNLLYVIVDEKRSVVGFLWCVVDVLTGILCINNFSMDRRYWKKGKAVDFLKSHVLNILKESKLKKIYWCTKHTKYCEKYGFKQSKNILMEFEENKHGCELNGNPNEADGASGTNDPRTEELPLSDSERSDSSSSGSPSKLTAAL